MLYSVSSSRIAMQWPLALQLSWADIHAGVNFQECRSLWINSCPLSNPEKLIGSPSRTLMAPLLCPVVHSLLWWTIVHVAPGIVLHDTCQHWAFPETSFSLSLHPVCGGVTAKIRECISMTVNRRVAVIWAILRKCLVTGENHPKRQLVTLRWADQPSKWAQANSQGLAIMGIWNPQTLNWPIFICPGRPFAHSGILIRHMDLML